MLGLVRGERVLLERPPPAAVGDVLVAGELLVAEEEHVVLEEGVVQLGHRLVVDVSELHS